jgi:Xaa-Pro aminopeptidase
MQPDSYHEELRKAKGFTPLDPPSEIQDRLRRLRAGLSEDGIDAAFIFGSALEPTWIRYYANYITPFVISEAILFISSSYEQPVLLIDRDWYFEAAKEMTGIPDIRVYPYVKYLHARKEIAQIIQRLSDEYRLENSRIGISLVTMPTLYYQSFTDAFPDAELVNVIPTLNRLSEYKSEYDKEMVRKSAAIADLGMIAAINACGEGVTECEAALAAESAMCLAGADYGGGVTARNHINIGSSSTIRSNVRGYNYTGRKLEKGDFFFIDLTCCYHGFYTDFCRTVSIGKPSTEQVRMHDCTMAMHERLLECVRPGISGEEIFHEGVKVALEWGYDRNQINCVWLGHGTGLMVSDAPFFQEGEKRQIHKDMFVNIEPGIFIPEIGTTSIEDQLFVSEQGIELVTQTPREIHIK